MGNKIHIEIVHASNASQIILPLCVPINSSIRQALEMSNLFPSVVDKLNVGIFGKLRHLEFRLEDGDRVEIYQHLHLDPKVARAQKVRLERRAKRLSRQKKVVERS